jgi:hypothetical protein
LRKNSTAAAVLKGHGFSRADKANKMSAALATEGWVCFNPPRTFAFFRKLFSPYFNVAKLWGFIDGCIRKVPIGAVFVSPALTRGGSAWGKQIPVINTGVP